MRGLTATFLLLGAAPAAAQEVGVVLTTAPDGTRTLAHEVIIAAKPRAVWKAVATVAGWQTWAVPIARALPGTDRFETNYDASAPLGAASGIEQQWVVRQVPRSAAFRTIRTPAGFPHAMAYLNVVSTFTLTPVGQDATRVRLIGAGYPAGAEGDDLIGFFRAGNTIALRQLHKRFVQGPIDWSKPTDRK